MYTKRIKIPAVGESNYLEDVAGEALQVLRLDFPGSEDPLGNPKFRADAGRIDSVMSVRNPLKQTFRGLEVVNESNSAAAGTIALVRVYEDAANFLQGRPRKQKVAQAPADYLALPLSDSAENISAGSSESLTGISAFRDHTGRITGAFLILGDGGFNTNHSGELSSGTTIEVKISLGLDFRGFTARVGVGEKEILNLVNYPVIVPSDQAFSLSVNSRGGSGEWDAFLRGQYYYDGSNEIPPE
jgi:hypothetical protein